MLAINLNYKGVQNEIAYIFSTIISSNDEKKQNNIKKSRESSYTTTKITYIDTKFSVLVSELSQLSITRSLH